MKKILIDKERVLSPGDTVILTYNAAGAAWLKATEAAIVESKLAATEGFFIKSIDYWTEGKIIMTVEVTKTNPIIVTVAYITSAVVGASVIFLAAGWMFEKAELVVNTPVAKAGSAALLIFAVLAVLAFGKGKISAFRS